MSEVTTEQLARLQAQLNNDANRPGESEANRKNLDESSTTPSVRSSASWVYGKSGLSSPNSSVDGENPRDSRAYRGSRGMPTPAQIFEREELLKRHKERTLLRDKATASAGSNNGVPVTSPAQAQNHTAPSKNQGGDWAEAHMWPLTREQHIEAYHRACREEPGYARLASPYYSVEQPSPTSKRAIDDSSSPEPKRQKRISEDKSEDKVHLTGVDADMPNLGSSETDSLGTPPSASSQYAIAREVRKRPKPPVQNLKERGGPKVSQPQGLTQLQQPDTKPFLHNPHDLWRPDPIGKTHKQYYEPHTEEEKFDAWLEANRERCELQKLQLKEVQEQMRRDYGLASWRDSCSAEQAQLDSAPQFGEMDNMSDKSPSTNSTSSMKSDSRSSTTTVSSDGNSPDEKEGKASIGEASVQSASQVQTAPYDLPVPAAELHTMRTEKPEEGPAAQETQDASQKLLPAQVAQTETTNSQPLEGSGVKKVPGRSIQALLAPLDTRKDTVPGISLVDADLADGLKQDMPKDLQLSESSGNAQVPPADTQSPAVFEEQEEIPHNRKKQKTPKTPHQGRKNKNEKKPLGPIPSKIEKPSARMTRSKAKTNHSTKFQKLDNAGRLPVDWTA